MLDWTIPESTAPVVKANEEHTCYVMLSIRPVFLGDVFDGLSCNMTLYTVVVTIIVSCRSRIYAYIFIFFDVCDSLEEIH